MDEAVLRLGTNHRLIFERQTDRWSHRIERLADDRWIAIWRSVEGTSADDWPASPPIQELHPHALDSGDCWLAVGRAGTAHWSLSIDIVSSDIVSSDSALLETVPNLGESQPSGLCLRFDVACRCSGKPGPLGSQYEIVESSWNEDDGEKVQHVQPSVAAGRWFINRSLTKAPSGASPWCFAPDVKEADASNKPQTLRWVYYWQAG